MGGATIRLVYNLQSGRHDIYVDYDSEADALPFEHEDAHRELIQQLIGASALGEDDLGEVVVSRVSLAEKSEILQRSALLETGTQNQAQAQGAVDDS